MSRTVVHGAFPAARRRPARPAVALAAAALITLIAPVSAPGQSLSGRVLDTRSDDPIPAATVTLLNEEDAVVAETVTDDQGRFRIDRAPAGTHRLRVQALGYQAVADREVEVRETSVIVRVLVEPTPLPTDGITVTVERPAPHLRTGRQVISGKVLDAVSREPVEGMDVVVRDVAGDPTGRTLSDEDGRFFLVVPNPGLYRLAVAGFGYDSTATARVAVAPEQDLYLELEVRPAALGLDPITVSAPRVIPFLEGSGFYTRMRRGQGTYFTPRDLDRMPGAFPTQMLRRIAGVSVTPRGAIAMRGVTGFMGGPCRPTIVLDGMFLRGTSIDDVIPMAWIDAVEVYKGPATVPAQWRAAGVCGLIAIWTKH